MRAEGQTSCPAGEEKKENKLGERETGRKERGHNLYIKEESKEGPRRLPKNNFIFGILNMYEYFSSCSPFSAFSFPPPIFHSSLLLDVSN